MSHLEEYTFYTYLGHPCLATLGNSSFHFHSFDYLTSGSYSSLPSYPLSVLVFCHPIECTFRSYLSTADKWLPDSLLGNPWTIFLVPFFNALQSISWFRSSTYMVSALNCEIKVLRDSPSPSQIFWRLEGSFLRRYVCNEFWFKGYNKLSEVVNRTWAKVLETFLSQTY